MSELYKASKMGEIMEKVAELLRSTGKPAIVIVASNPYNEEGPLYYRYQCGRMMARGMLADCQDLEARTR